MKVLVYGGTGSQGNAIVARLLSQGHEPTILTRSPEKAAEWATQGVKVAVGDMGDVASLEQASQGMDAIALTITFVLPDLETAYSYGRNAIDAAKKAGVRLIVYNTSGPVLTAPIGNVGYDVRRLVIDHLKASGVDYIVVKPTTYLENLLGPWTRQGIIENDVLAYPVQENRSIGWIATADLAALTVAALEHPELAPLEVVISGEANLTGPQLAERISKGLGRTIRYEAMPLDVFGATLDSMFGHGASEGVLPGYRLLRDHPEQVTHWTDMRLVLRKLPVEMTSVEAWAEQFASLFAPQPVTQGEV
jgi:uncharacterized protein YbjT (DUF2867 family)